MAYGIFRGEEHVYTIPNKLAADGMARNLGLEFYVRELTYEEYWKRMKEIYVECKYK